MESENEIVWSRRSSGLVSFSDAKFVNARFGNPKSNGFCETPPIPRSPVTLLENAYRFSVEMRWRLKSTCAMLVSFPNVRMYDTGISKLRVDVFPPTLG